jgi:hypothetical protein
LFCVHEKPGEVSSFEKKNWGVSSSWHLFVPIRVGLISSDILKSWSLSRDVPERFESGLVEAQEPLQIPVY